jgi:hypothetical protein
VETPAIDGDQFTQPDFGDKAPVLGSSHGCQAVSIRKTIFGLDGHAQNPSLFAQLAVLPDPTGE